MSRSPSRFRALILDDEKSIAGLCARVLLALGASSNAVGTVAEAAARIRAERYDLMICDMRLPDGAGLDVEPLYRSLNPDGRVLVITGSLAPGHPALAEGSGIRVLSKPFELAELRAVVASIIAEHAGAEGGR